MTRWLLVLALLSLAPAASIVWGAEEDEEALTVTQRVTIHLRDFRFDPSTITLKSGETAEVTLINDGTVLHEFVIPSFHNLTVDLESNGVIAETLGIVEMELPPKATVVLRFTPEEPGTHPFACHAKKPKDHFAAGMTGTLIVK
jgi:plastocyanin